jgi:hypothetical protein
MSNDSSHNEEYPELGKLLKSLPKKAASPDFEMRLQRRIKEGKSVIPEKGFTEKEFSSFRIPTFAFSLMTLLVVGTIAYYAYFRSPEVQQLPEQEIPVLNDRESAPVQSSPDKAISPDQSTPDIHIKEQTTDAAVTTQQSQETGETSASVKQEAEPKQKQLMEYRALPRKTEPLNSETKENAIQEESRQEVGLPPAQMAAPVQEDPRQEQEITLPEKKNDAISAPTYLPPQIPVSKGIAPALKSATQLNAFIERDSVMIRDSIRADSLQKLLKLNRKNQKIRKPFN